MKKPNIRIKKIKIRFVQECETIYSEPIAHFIQYKTLFGWRYFKKSIPGVCKYIVGGTKENVFIEFRDSKYRIINQGFLRFIEYPTIKYISIYESVH